VLSLEFNIYLTDVYKAYFVQENTISNTIPSYTNHPIHKELIEKEIIEVKPNAVLCWGKEARDLVANLLDIQLKATISKDDIRIPYKKEIAGVSFSFLATPHPSRLTRPKSWESFFGVNLPGEDHSDSKLRPKKLANLIISVVSL
jgi:uracil-DNA glycosylase